MSKREDVKNAFIEALLKKYPPGTIINREQVGEVADSVGLKFPHWFVQNKSFKRGFNQYQVMDDYDSFSITQNAVTDDVIEEEEKENISDEKLIKSGVPKKFPGFIRFGNYEDIVTILKTEKFFPIMIHGMSGNGKTLSTEQACAVLGRELIRVNVSIETDQTDLIGGPTLVNGNVVNRDGPVIEAMKRGAVCLIDEVDRGSNKLLCLQGILEGKPYYNKNNNEIVYPKPGFTIVATANSKGRGSEDGRYLSQILDDAFLERFHVTFEQEYPDTKIEEKIINNVLKTEKKPFKSFANNLCVWAKQLRDSYFKGSSEELISTRRLVDIAMTFGIFENKMKSIELCLNRFHIVEKKAFIDAYKMIDKDWDINTLDNAVVIKEEEIVEKEEIQDDFIQGTPFG